jgi:ketosteroid isomerase-like protein
MWAEGAVDLVTLFQQGGSDLDRLAAVLDPDTEIAFLPTEPGAPDPALRGTAGLAEGWMDWLEPYESYLLVIEDFVDGPEGVYMPAQVTARTRRDGVEVTHEPAAVCVLRHGRVRRLFFYLDRAEARADAGLDE